MVVAGPLLFGPLLSAAMMMSAPHPLPSCAAVPTPRSTGIVLRTSLRQHRINAAKGLQSQDEWMTTQKAPSGRRQKGSARRGESRMRCFGPNDSASEVDDIVASVDRAIHKSRSKSPSKRVAAAEAAAKAAASPPMPSDEPMATHPAATSPADLAAPPLDSEAADPVELEHEAAEEPLVAVDGTAAPGVALLHFALSQ